MMWNWTFREYPLLNISVKEMNVFTDKNPQWTLPDAIYRPGPMLCGSYGRSHFVGQLSVSVRKCLRQSAYKGERFVGAHSFLAQGLPTLLLLSLGWGGASWYGREGKALPFIAELWKTGVRSRDWRHTLPLKGGPQCPTRLSFLAQQRKDA